MKTKVMGIGTPWSAPELTRAQRACLAKHGIRVHARTAMAEDGTLWALSSDGGRDHVTPRQSWTARCAARAEWARR